MPDMHKVVDFEQKYYKQDDLGLRSLLRSWLRKQRRKCTCKRFFLKNFPIIDGLRGYRPLRDLPADVISGLTVGVMHIPQGLAFAALATLPPIVGLYVSFISCLVYFFVGGCRQASFGVIAITCLMMGSVLDRELAQGDVIVSDARINQSAVNDNVTVSNTMSSHDLDARKIQLATAVSFIGGVFMMGLGKLGCGFVTTYMPESLIRGFTTGAATHVAVGQMSSLFGLSIPRHNGALKIIFTIIDVCKNLPKANWVTVVISIISIIIMYVIKVHVNQRFSKKLKIPIPIELIVMIVCIVISKYAQLPEEHNLKIVGDIPTGVPPPTFPDLSVAKNRITDAIVIAIVAFTQSVALSKTFALKHGYKLDSNQEMFANGVCTTVSSLFSGITAAASMARTIVQDGTGGVSQIASMIGCVIVLMVILFLGPLFFYLPYCILSSVIIVNLRSMFRQFLLLKPYWKQSKVDFTVFVATYLAVVVVDVDVGLGVGVGVALLSVVVRTQWVDIAELGAVDDLDIYKPIALYEKANRSSTTRILRFSSPLYFANEEAFRSRIFKVLGIKSIAKLKRNKTLETQMLEKNGNPTESLEALTAEPPWTTHSSVNIRHVILDMSGSTFLDTVGVNTLQQVIQDFSLADIRVYVVGLPETTYSVMKATGVWKKCSDHLYLSLNDVLDELNLRAVSSHL